MRFTASFIKCTLHIGIKFQYTPLEEQLTSSQSFLTHSGSIGRDMRRQFSEQLYGQIEDEMRERVLASALKPYHSFSSPRRALRAIVALIISCVNLIRCYIQMDTENNSKEDFLEDLRSRFWVYHSDQIGYWLQEGVADTIRRTRL